MDTPDFQRKIEDFTCEHCGVEVVGNGYTNHCPKCLWCKHVDVNPGDRASHCNGLMKPVGVEEQAGGYKIVHRCVTCGFERKNKMAENDAFDVALTLNEEELMR